MITPNKMTIELEKLYQQERSEKMQLRDINKELVSALKEAQSYILNRDKFNRKKFDIKNSNDFHIAVVINEAIKLNERTR